MTDMRRDQETYPSQPKRRKGGEQAKPIETDGQLDLDLHTSDDLDAILVELFD